VTTGALRWDPVEACSRRAYREDMTQPEADPTHEKAHVHIDLGALMDGSERGPEIPDEGGAGEYGEAADLSGETSDGYVAGQDEGSID
jgi:hypothetical protein